MTYLFSQYLFIVSFVWEKAGIPDGVSSTYVYVVDPIERRESSIELLIPRYENRK
jgi:hypothetical protein